VPPIPPPLKHPQVQAPPRAASVALREALVATFVAARGCTLVSQLVPVTGAAGDGVWMAPYPTILMAAVNMTEDYPERPPTVSEAAFEAMTKSVRQRWIRKIKKYVACLRSAHRISEDENTTDAAMAEAVDFATTAAARAAIDDSMPAADGADLSDEEVPDAAPAANQAQQA
jgi:hypothetical protein